MPDSEYDAKLKQLMASYAESLPPTIDEISRHWQAVTGHWDAQQVNALMKLCHQLAGSASTFGFPAITSNAREAEQTLRACVENQRSPGSEERQKIDQCLAALRAELDKTR